MSSCRSDIQNVTFAKYSHSLYRMQLIMSIKSKMRKCSALTDGLSIQYYIGTLNCHPE